MRLGEVTFQKMNNVWLRKLNLRRELVLVEGNSLLLPGIRNAKSPLE